MTTQAPDATVEALREAGENLLSALSRGDDANIHGWAMALRKALAALPRYRLVPVEEAAGLDELRALSEAATPGRWHRYTVGHRSVRQAAGAVTRALFAVNVDREVRPLMTDLSWVETDATEEHVALIGNGPKQTDNADFIVAAVNYVRAALSESHP